MRFQGAKYAKNAFAAPDPAGELAAIQGPLARFKGAYF